ncbi:MAG TPA: hypothetical protein PK511_00555 [Chitinophagales bacterium]|nr:hypothetical protein [Chitinophagales bacterium]HMX03181.1 hypothetical protein [Chitinophagales bacterium]HMZ88137.1 hypothetical protein [Chitinophagales bacterium]HNA56499.1 hypothetical protein [Chitinophagales bacterium]HNE45345.1 hypothetical protein [Chitinophagales bacterium]
MLHPEILRQILPGLVTSVAIRFPVAYIRSITFHVHEKMVAACFWQQEEQRAAPFTIGENNMRSGCYIYNYDENIRESEVEITGMDESGKAFLISMPYNRIVPMIAA